MLTKFKTKYFVSYKLRGNERKNFTDLCNKCGVAGWCKHGFQTILFQTAYVKAPLVEYKYIYVFISFQKIQFKETVQVISFLSNFIFFYEKVTCSKQMYFFLFIQFW